VLGDTLGSAAWNGVNLVVCLYLIASIGGTIGLLAGFFSAFSTRKIFKWITCVSALAMMILSGVYAAGFIFGRTEGVPLSAPFYFGRFPTPILLFYAIAILFCLVEALLYLPSKIKLGAR
jgi:ABC-type branched-subunit amino acid transport system permease subunit